MDLKYHVGIANNVKKKKEIALTIAFGAAMILFAVFYTEGVRNATQETRYLIFTILAAIIVIFLHFIKKIRIIRENKSLEMLFDSLELLMIVATPVISSFELLTKWYPDNPDYKLVLVIGAIFSWFIVTMYRTNRAGDEDEGKVTKAISSLIYAGILFISGLAVWIIIAF